MSKPSFRSNSGADSQTGPPIERGIDQRRRADIRPQGLLGRDDLRPILGGPFPDGPEKRVGKEVSAAPAVHRRVACHASRVVAFSRAIFSPGRGCRKSRIAIFG